MRKTISLIIGVTIMSLGAVYLAIAWTEPVENPPAGNVATPINESLIAQAKQGALVVGANSAVTTGLIVQYGKVGIGTTDPSEKLEVEGNAKITGTLNMSSQKITSVSSPTDNTDAATKGYVDAQAGGDGGSCYVGWNTTTCGTGYTQMYAGYIAVINIGNVGSSSTVGPFCSVTASSDSGSSVAMGWTTRPYYPGPSLSNLRCALCCK